MTEYRTCGCVVPHDGERIFCAAHDPSRQPEIPVTHILGVAYVSICGRPSPGSSITGQHYRERLTKPAIAGQLARLPHALCARCVEAAG